MCQTEPILTFLISMSNTDECGFSSLSVYTYLLNFMLQDEVHWNWACKEERRRRWWGWPRQKEREVSSFPFHIVFNSSELLEFIFLKPWSSLALLETIEQSHGTKILTSVTMVKWLVCRTFNPKFVGSNPTKLTADFKMTRISVMSFS